MRVPRRAVRPLKVVALLPMLAALLLAACGGDDETNSPSSSSSSASTSTTATATAAAPREITVGVTDHTFSPANIEISANQAITLTLQNNEPAGEGDPIRHSWHLLNVKDTNGVEPGTALIPPGTSTAITFAIPTPGTYNFQCDVHPDRMKGTLTVR